MYITHGENGISLSYIVIDSYIVTTTGILCCIITGVQRHPRWRRKMCHRNPRGRGQK